MVNEKAPKTMKTAGQQCESERDELNPQLLTHCMYEFKFTFLEYALSLVEIFENFATLLMNSIKNLRMNSNQDAEPSWSLVIRATVNEKMALFRCINGIPLSCRRKD